MRAFGSLLLAAILCAATGPAFATDNARLAAIFKQDQQVRQKEPIDWTTVNAQDKRHREEVLSLLKTGKLQTSIDYYRAAMVFQHGAEVDDYRLAFSLAQISVALDPANKQARWLTAASWDRILKYKNLPQWYGTQYYQPEPNAPVQLWKVDESAVSDAERAKMNVPSLQEARDMAREFQ